MKKILDITLITIVSLSSALATAVVIHDVNEPQPNVVSTYLERLWNSVNDRWLKVHQAPSVPPQAAPTFNQGLASAVSTTPKPNTGQAGSMGQTGNSVGGPSLQFSAADFQRLNQITQKLLPALTPVELSKLLNDFQTQDTAAATRDISNLLTNNLSPSDIAWLQTRFQGENAFSAKDVELLQTAVNQLESSLTPSEQQMVFQQLSGFLRQH